MTWKRAAPCVSVLKWLGIRPPPRLVRHRVRSDRRYDPACRGLCRRPLVQPPDPITVTLPSSGVLFEIGLAAVQKPVVG